MKVTPKKRLGQHFLINTSVCERIVNSLPTFETPTHVLEIGPGKGAITSLFLQRTDLIFHAFEVDNESIEYLKVQYPDFLNIHKQDFLNAQLLNFFSDDSFCVVGNFPYNISSQILFRCLEYRDQIPIIMGMFQKEVARRVAATPGNKEYGILSVIMQAFYRITYLFTVEPGSFFPPPKVKSGVILCERLDRKHLECDEKLFVKVVKLAFNQRRKTLRNSLKNLGLGEILDGFERKRPEQLSVEDFIQLTQFIEKNVKN